MEGRMLSGADWPPPFSFPSGACQFLSVGWDMLCTKERETANQQVIMIDGTNQSSD